MSLFHTFPSLGFTFSQPYPSQTAEELSKDRRDAPTFQPLNIDETLKERGSRYGKFTEHARITQNIKTVMIDSPNWLMLDDDMRESLEMVAHKIGRILNGDPNYHDSWHDIGGYIKLVADRLLTGEEK